MDFNQPQGYHTPIPVETHWEHLTRLENKLTQKGRFNKPCGFGFYSIGVEPNIYHLYHPDQPLLEINEFVGVHTHKAKATSNILAGKITHVEYECKPSKHGYQLVDDYNQAEEGRQKYELKPSYLTGQAGQTYHLTENMFHGVEAPQLAITHFTQPKPTADKNAWALQVPSNYRKRPKLNPKQLTQDFQELIQQTKENLINTHPQLQEWVNNEPTHRHQYAKLLLSK